MLKSLLSGGGCYFWRDRYFQDLLAKTKINLLSLFSGVASLGVRVVNFGGRGLNFGRRAVVTLGGGACNFGRWGLNFGRRAVVTLGGGACNFGRRGLNFGRRAVVTLGGGDRNFVNFTRHMLFAKINVVEALFAASAKLCASLREFIDIMMSRSKDRINYRT